MNIPVKFYVAAVVYLLLMVSTVCDAAKSLRAADQRSAHRLVDGIVIAASMAAIVCLLILTFNGNVRMNTRLIMALVILFAAIIPQWTVVDKLLSGPDRSGRWFVGLIAQVGLVVVVIEVAHYVLPDEVWQLLLD